MGIEVRSCRDDEMQQYYDIGSYVFADPELIPTENGGTAPDWTTCAWVDGTLASIMGAFPFTVRLNGAPVKMAGVTQVGTLPGYRRQGLLRKIMTRAFSDMREREQPFAILWASMGAIYQRFGYGLASDDIKYRFDPRTAALRENDEPKGSVSVETVEQGYPTAKMLYIESATPRNLHIHRSRALWEVGIFRMPKDHGPVRVAIYRDADGQPRGHIVYQAYHAQFDTPGPDQMMDVRDFVYLDLGAHRALWQYILKHDLVRRVDMHGCIGEDDPTPDLLLEPRMLGKHTKDGIWMRVIDVEKALSSRPYGAAGEIVIEVTGDSMCPWNEGRWLLATDGQMTSVARTSRATDLNLSPNALASLLAGYRSATRLSRLGTATPSRPETLRAADAMFATEYAPHCPNSF
ncbi:MAG: GNAT family N-acetyltransferase [Dehalococcoidia bacterium]|nr:GNAT family N-acetyltransferase [Dehalococcoidia bacterium]